MCVKVFGRKVNAHAGPIHNGYFIRCAVTDVFGIQVGSKLEVDETRCQVKRLIANSQENRTSGRSWRRWRRSPR